MNLFDTLKIRGLELKNRVIVSPMCQYSAVDGVPSDWHLVHLGSRAVGGASVVFTEATAVEARGRISAGDTGIYSSAQVEAWKRISRFIRAQGAIPGIQLAHAGRKGSTPAPWVRGPVLLPKDGGWLDVVSASNLPFSEDSLVPIALSIPEIKQTTAAFVSAAKNALAAGFEIAELHAAHGYLLHQFLSPISNKRSDEYGGSFENRIRFVCETATAVRAIWPEHLPLFVRLSATDYIPGGWDVEQSIGLSKHLKKIGVDLIDVSSGGIAPNVKIEVGPGYQVPFAAKIKQGAEVLVSAVGMIEAPEQAQAIISSGKADAVMLAREFLRDPYWTRRAAKELRHEIHTPEQYLRSW